VVQISQGVRTLDKNIEILKNIIVEVVDPDKIILFGSYAYGNPKEKSDADFLVLKDGLFFDIEKTGKLITIIRRRKNAQGVNLRCDLFFDNEPNAYELAFNRGGAYAEALSKGKVVYVRS